MKKVKILEVEKEVLKKIDMICRFACCKYSVKQGNIINIKESNIAYVSPHIITIKQNNYLIFNESDKEKTINLLKECYEKDLYNSHNLIDVSKNTDKEMVINHFIKEEILEKEYDYFDQLSRILCLY